MTCPAILFPDKLAVAGECLRPRCPVEDVHGIGVHGWRARRVSMKGEETAVPRFRDLWVHWHVPDDLAIGPVKTDEVPNQFLGIAWSFGVELIAAVTGQVDVA